MPSLNNSDFRLVQFVATQLQVLLPGETNNPSLPNGKGGTATPIHNGDTVLVTVNSVDAGYHIVNSSGDPIHLDTSDDGNAITPVSNSPLVNGTMSDYITFEAAESWTITATDTANSFTGTETFTALP
jgi:hypothetical protein